MDRDTPIVLPEYISAYLEFPEQLGLKRAELSKKSGVDLESLAETPRPYTLNEILNLIEVGITELKMPYGGLAIGHQMRLTCHGAANLFRMPESCLPLVRKSVSTLYHGILRNRKHCWHPDH